MSWTPGERSSSNWSNGRRRLEKNDCPTWGNSRSTATRVCEADRYSRGSEARKAKKSAHCWPVTSSTWTYSPAPSRKPTPVRAVTGISCLTVRSAARAGRPMRVPPCGSGRLGQPVLLEDQILGATGGDEEGRRQRERRDGEAEQEHGVERAG